MTVHRPFRTIAQRAHDIEAYKTISFGWLIVDSARTGIDALRETIVELGLDDCDSPDDHLYAECRYCDTDISQEGDERREHGLCEHCEIHESSEALHEGQWRGF